MKLSKRVFVAMSGGVDSSVAALLLRKKYDVVGVFMRSYNIDGCAERDAEDARRVAGRLGIPFYVWDFEEEYKKRVVEYMVKGYRDGITPNPDVMCNKEIKFGLFLERALAMGADYVATGHYVRLEKFTLRKQHNPPPAVGFASPSTRDLRFMRRAELAGLRDVPQNKLSSPYTRLSHFVLKNISERRKIGSTPGWIAARERGAFCRWSKMTPFLKNEMAKSHFGLFAAKDLNKDQSYFLWTLTQDQLQHCLFPIGDYLKPQVRAIAKRAGLPTADKKDSQGICFLGKVTLADFLKTYIPEKRGAILTTSGKKVGEHSGSHFYTIGQRHGLGIGGGKIYYVAEKNKKNNTLIVAEGSDNEALFKREIRLTNLNFTCPIEKNLDVFARVRYRQPVSKASLQIRGKKAELVFERPQKFVASGQSAVFYTKSGEMLGGGVII